jgi:hypothetical protein
MSTKKQKQPRLPGQEDAAITELETAAEGYAETRDQRQALLAEEVEQKAQLLALMKRHKKEHYEHNGVIIDIVHEEETVKVKIAKAKEQQEPAA